VAWHMRGAAAAASARRKATRKEMKRAAKQAKAKCIAEMVDKTKGGARCYREAVRAISGADSRVKAVKIQKFLDSDGTHARPRKRTKLQWRRTTPRC